MAAAVEPGAKRRLQTALSRVDAFVHRPVDGRPIVLARFLIGAIIALAYATLWPHAMDFFGPAGIGGHDTVSEVQGFDGLAYQAFAKFRVLDRIGAEPVVMALYLALIACAALFAVGFWTRISGAGMIALHVIFNAHNPHVRGGWAWIIPAFAIYLLLSDPGRAWSVDAWRRARATHSKKGDRSTRPSSLRPFRRHFCVPPIGKRLIMTHITTIYLVAGWGRVGAEGWSGGEMVYRTLANSMHGRFDLDWFALMPELHALTLVIYVLEPAAVVLLWVPRVRPYFAVAMLGLHLGLETFADAGYWQWMMVAGLIQFLRPRWFDRPFGLLGGQKAARAPA